ncbi:MAG TPA: hypothetical protein VNY07_10955 [Chthoniobacterales bacterium]|jgi:hypothetical protein|nr:hypothetical protein [Chthoniobacterales bacterium]
MISRPYRLAFFPCLGAVVVSVFLAAGVELRAATITAASVSLPDVSAAITSAVNGDTVIVPAGTASWTSQLVITNTITLIGQTTTDSVHGTAVDKTIIVDNVTGNSSRPLILVSSSSGKSYRISGFTFQDARATQTINGYIVVEGQSNSARIDHCHFTTMPNQSQYIHVSEGVYGVADHNLFEPAHTQSFRFENGNVGASGLTGNPAWSSPTGFGGANFFFVEDNYFRTNYTRQQEITDGASGCRFVLRHNYIYGGVFGNHGTEGQDRGGRAMEVYNNVFKQAYSAGSFGQLRSGSLMFFNNTYTGHVLGSGGVAIEVQRAEVTFGPTFGGADGSSPWDVNVTESNGTWVDGHSPYQYFPASGYATCANPAPTPGQIIDSNTPNWTTNQWTNFGVIRQSDGAVGLITGNTANTLNIYLITVGLYPVNWANGDQYQIHKVLTVLDQTGRGQGDLLTGTAPNYINSVTGTKAWPHQVLDPAYSWSNRQGATHVDITGLNSVFVANRDFYNEALATGTPPSQTTGVGVGLLANRPVTGAAGTDFTGVTSSPPGTAYWATDVPSVNGSTDSGALYVWQGGAWVLYYQPYTYPHPLVSGVLSPPSNLRVVH